MCLFEKCLTPVDSVLANAALQPPDISHMLLVGGSSQIRVADGLGHPVVADFDCPQISDIGHLSIGVRSARTTASDRSG
jgi:hypothetical protein